jgi:hypothetical protein
VIRRDRRRGLAGSIVSIHEREERAMIAAIYARKSCIREEQMVTHSGPFPAGSPAAAPLAASENGLLQR